MQKVKNFFYVIGDPISHSLSPIMYNSAFKLLNIQKYNYFKLKKVKENKLFVVLKEFRNSNVKGVAVTIPHKQNVIKFLDKLDSSAKTIGAVNTILNRNGKLIGYNTDYIGAIKALRKFTSLKNKKIAIFGSGGSARAIIFGLIKQNAELSIFNRTFKNALTLANEFHCKALPISKLNQLINFDIIINTTPVGMINNKSLIPKKYISHKQIIFDIIYNPYETIFIKNGISNNTTVIRGVEMFLEQAYEQFKLFTNLNPPKSLMREIVLKKLLKK
ncbi:MAG: shikimate dehydrogenase [Bacteroidetes bacterium]|nr:shikimate dehydrogenase [Bacteroidota bacterium]